MGGQNELEAELGRILADQVPHLLAEPGVGPITGDKLPPCRRARVQVRGHGVVVPGPGSDERRYAARCSLAMRSFSSDI